MPRMLEKLMVKCLSFGSFDGKIGFGIDHFVVDKRWIKIDFIKSRYIRK